MAPKDRSGCAIGSDVLQELSMNAVTWAVARPPSAFRRLLIGGRLFLALLTTDAAHCEEWLYPVVPGDNLWNLTEDYLISMDYWPRLQALNGVADPRHLPPGMKLRMPISWLKRLPATAKVISVQGQAQAVIAGTRGTVPLKPGMQLQSGDAITTGPDSNVTVEFRDGSQLLLQADGELVMDTLESYGPSDHVDTRLSLPRGRVENRVVPRSGSAPRYEIQTPAATSAVRGTRYRLGMDPANSTAQTEVLAGTVAMKGERGSRNVSRGFGVLTRIGEPPGPLVRLLAPPDVRSLPPIVTRVPIQLALPALQGAAAYRTQIAATEEFETVLSDTVSVTPAIRGPALPDGDYVLRVRGIDPSGLEGHDTQYRVTIHARPEPPFLIQPVDGSAALQKSLVFEWSEPQDAAAYHLQLTRDEHFGTPLLDIADYGASRFIPSQPLEPGRYQWRVAVRDSTGREGPFSDSQSFRLQAMPELQPPEVTADTITFRWSAGLPGQQYQFELARDLAFESVEVSAQVAEPQLQVARPESGFHYLRMRLVDADGSVGPYGPVQRIDVPPATYWPYGIAAFLTLVLIL